MALRRRAPEPARGVEVFVGKSRREAVGGQTTPRSVKRRTERGGLLERLYAAAEARREKTGYRGVGTQFLIKHAQAALDD